MLVHGSVDQFHACHQKPEHHALFSRKSNQTAIPWALTPKYNFLVFLFVFNREFQSRNNIVAISPDMTFAPTDVPARIPITFIHIGYMLFSVSE